MCFFIPLLGRRWSIDPSHLSVIAAVPLVVRVPSRKLLQSQDFRSFIKVFGLFWVFFYRVKGRDLFSIAGCTHPDFLALFAEEAVFLPTCIFGTFVETRWL